MYLQGSSEQLYSHLIPFSSNNIYDWVLTQQANRTLGRASDYAIYFSLPFEGVLIVNCVDLLLNRTRADRWNGE